MRTLNERADGQGLRREGMGFHGRPVGAGRPFVFVETAIAASRMDRFPP
jgi:hypothetical protein